MNPAAAAGPAFVAGATGYTGQAVVAELRRRGFGVVAHVRPDSARVDEWRKRWEPAGVRVNTARWDDDAMAAALAEIQPAVVLALLGTTRKRMQSAGEAASSNSYEAVDYGLPATLLRASRRAVPAAHFIYLSAVGTGPSARGEYLRVRWRLEEELRASGMRHTILKPAFITGSDRQESRPLERVAGRAADLVLSVAGMLGARAFRERYRSRTAAELAAEIADRIEAGPATP